MVLRILSPSFARGELSPLLHARVDMQSYPIGLARCENFIILPQGGATRRPGWVRHEDWGTWTGTECPVRLMPFIYSTADSMVLVFQNLQIKAISASCLPDERGRVYDIYNTPYTIKQAKELRFVQSGNVIFLTHGDHPVRKMERFYDSGIRFRLSDLTYRGGPWTTDERDTGLSGVEFRYIGKQQGKRVLKASEDFFTQDDVGRLFELNHTIHDKTVELRAQKDKVFHLGNWEASASTVYSNALEVGSEWYFQTYDRWEGTITLQRLPIGADASDDNAWEDWRPHNRPNADDVGNAQLSGSEEEGPAYYRMKFKIDAGTARATLTRSGFTRTDRFKLIEMEDSKTMLAEYQADPNSIYTSPYPYTWTSDWRIGSWGGGMGYPSAVAIFQDRLVLAATKAEPQSIWLSRTGDYQDFSTTSGNLKDDDSIGLTIAADDMSGIHSLATNASDLIAFTSTSEWRIKGAGDSGAITPTAITAHRQSKIGSAPIQPTYADNALVFIQTHCGEAYTLKYTFELDGYAGSNLSIMSEHLFRRGREIVDMAYQQTPDSLIWIQLANGDLATCTFQQEHQVYAWARQVTDGKVGSICVVPRADGYDEVWAVIQRNGKWAIETLSDRRDDMYYDNGRPYKSQMATLRVNSAEHFHSKKLISRLAVYARNSIECKAEPVTDVKGARWRRLEFPQPLDGDMEYEMVEADIMLDNGWERHAGVRIWTDTANPLTILAVSPEVTVGG